jgi:hypothetical protein
MLKDNGGKGSLAGGQIKTPMTAEQMGVKNTPKIYQYDSNTTGGHSSPPKGNGQIKGPGTDIAWPR